MKKKALSLLLVLAMTLVLVLPALAAEVRDPETGASHFFSIEDGVLTRYRGDYGAFTAVIPNTVKEIKASAFSFVSGLWSVTIPDSVTKIGDSAFYDCEDLREVRLPAGLKRIEHDTFSRCEDLRAVELPEGLEYIGASAFYNCESLTEITIPSTVTYIGDYAFADCENLESVHLPAGVQIGKDAFDDTAWLDIKAYGSQTASGFVVVNGRLTAYNGKGGDITVPAGVTAIDGSVFENNKTITKVVLPEGLTTIGESAFEGCSRLESVNLPASLTYLGESAFESTALRSVAIPAGVTALEEDTFSVCWELKSVTLPSTLRSIGEGAFEYCAGLTDLTIPAGVTRIDEDAFANCAKLTLHVTPGSYAEKYAKRSNLPMVADGGASSPAQSAQPTQPKAQPSIQTVTVDGKKVEFRMYALGGGSTNYIRVRDLAVILNGTAAQFNVDWKNNRVTLTGKTPYAGSSSAAPFTTPMAYENYADPTRVNGRDVKLEAIQITYNGGGHTYYKLRDLAEALGFNVGYSKATGIYVETGKPYDPGN